MNAKSQHVIANTNGGWSVQSAGAGRAAKRFIRQEDAIAYARERAEHQKAELYVHGTDGMVRERLSFRGSTED